MTIETGTLTPRSNNTVDSMRFSGGFGQSDGFSSVLTARVACSGELCLTLQWKSHLSGTDQMWSVTLTNEQRDALAQFCARYQPRLYEKIQDA